MDRDRAKETIGVTDKEEGRGTIEGKTDLGDGQNWKIARETHYYMFYLYVDKSGQKRL